MRNALLIQEPLAVADPLAEWRWRLGGRARLVALSRAGDAFVRLANEQVWWLDCGSGSLTEVAASVVAFEHLLNQPINAAKLLLAPVIEASVRRDGPFQPGTCLAFTQLPILGGSYALENRWRAPATEHLGLTGELHRQLRDTPDGTSVRVDVVD
jgi:hypothetical protein